MKFIFLAMTLLSTFALAADESKIKDIHCIISDSKSVCAETKKERVGLAYNLSLNCVKTLVVEMPDTSKEILKIRGTGKKSQAVIQNIMGSAMIVSYLTRRDMEKQGHAMIKEKINGARYCR